MSLDDSLRGVIFYALRTGWSVHRIEELRGEYRRGERLYEEKFPMPKPNKDNPFGYQATIVEWIKSRELIAAQITRDYINKNKQGGIRT